MSIHCGSEQDGEVCMQLSVLRFEIFPTQRSILDMGAADSAAVDS